METNNNNESKAGAESVTRIESQSIVLADGVTRRSALSDGSLRHTLSTAPECRTLFDALKRGARLSTTGHCLGERFTNAQGKSRYVWLSYHDVQERAQQIGSALLGWGYEAGEGSMVGTIGLTTAEQLTVNLACAGYSLVVVPLYHNYHLEARLHIIRSCSLATVFADSKERVESLLKHKGETPSLKRIVLMKGKLDKDLKKDHPDVQLLQMEEVLHEGHVSLRPFQPPQPESLCLVCHTSGTTGQPKGVELTHRNLIAAASACAEMFHRFGSAVGPGDTYLAFLPYAHVFEQLNSAHMLMSGARIGFYSGDPTKLVDDMALLKPTIVAMVPRLLNRIRDWVLSAVEAKGGWRRALFHRALAAKERLLDDGIITKKTLWDRLAFAKVRVALGGELRQVYSGGAPVAPEVLRFFRCVLGAVVVEGYGQTECAAAATITLPNEMGGGTVGGPTTATEVRLGDVPDMGLEARDGRGEVLIRGPSVMRGYYKNPAATAETIDADGWLHTGDVGEWDAVSGGLRIVDRAKGFFKLSQGDYVSPEAIELAYSTSPLVHQVFVTGEPSKSHLVGLAVAEEEPFRAHLRRQGLYEEADLPTEQLLDNAKVSTAFLTHLRVVGAERGLSSLEQVKAVALMAEPLSLDNGLLTPLLKLRRQEARRHFADAIERLYEQAKP